MQRGIDLEEVKEQMKRLKRPPRSLIKKIEEREKNKRGWIAAIHRDTGEYFLGKTVVSAITRARKKYPDHIFYLIRIGYPAVESLHGGFKPL